MSLAENVTEIGRVTDHFWRSLASDEVCSGKTVSAEIAVKSTGFRKIVAA